MNTFYDFVAIAIFAGIVAVFVQRAMADHEDPRPMWSYIVPAIGCAVLNQLGNHGQDLAAMAMLVATLAYVALILRPFGTFGGR